MSAVELRSRTILVKLETPDHGNIHYLGVSTL